MNKDKKSSIYYFSIILKKLVEGEGYGAKSKLAKALQVGPSMIGDIIGGRKGASDSLKDSIADYFGTTVADMLLMGEQLDKTGIYFPYLPDLKNFTLRSPERAARILELVAEKEYKLMLGPISSKAIQHFSRVGANDYINSGLSEQDYYMMCKQYIKSALRFYLKGE